MGQPSRRNRAIFGAHRILAKHNGLYGDFVLAPARSVVKQHFPINGRIAADLCTSAMPTQSSERRGYPRLPAPKGTIVAWHSFNKRVVSAVVNLGLGGLNIRTAIPRQPEPSFSCFSMRRREKCALAPRSKEVVPNKVWA